MHPRRISPPTSCSRSEETDGHMSMTEIEVPPRSPGPPLHTHDFDEALYVLEAS